MATLDGIEVKSGDSLWHVIGGWCKVINAVGDVVTVDKYPLAYYNFKEESLPTRRFFWDEIDKTPPPKPKDKVKKWRWVMRYFGIDDLYVTEKHYSEEEVERLFTSTVVQKVDSTEVEE